MAHAGRGKQGKTFSPGLDKVIAELERRLPDTTALPLFDSAEDHVPPDCEDGGG